ncbi:MAG: 3-phosphoshikimate 1-carboxyvinyltransferase [Eubacteriales bacterium]|nr:3-phosphoshikimate 1-carboxyvinyltransferase [Eubacteriales bacterium]
MLYKISKSENMSGDIEIPGSKSHTIRALFLGALAEGVSTVRNPLFSSDTQSAIDTCRAMGAEILAGSDAVKIKGFNGKPHTPDDVINTGNSGTTITFAISVAALNEGYTILTGDAQVRRRPQEPLIKSCVDLGAQVVSASGKGFPPIIVKGRMRGGKTGIRAITSQYLSSLLISAPFAEGDSLITVEVLNEAPYVGMTLDWLSKLGIEVHNKGFDEFSIRGGQRLKAFDTSIPGDFSSAAFFLVLAAISGGNFKLLNLDMSDSQGDKAVVEILRDMGARVTINKDDNSVSSVSIEGAGLKGMEIDMNPIPDALPAMAVAACFAKGETRLVNVPQARYKETDRISAMCIELRKMGADVRELPDGLLIRESRLKGSSLSGYGDHRIVMALTVAALCSEGESFIDTAESVSVTFPGFGDLITACGGKLTII